VRQQHYEYAVAPHHALSGIVRKLRIVGETQCGVKVHGPLHVLHCEIEEDLFCHFGTAEKLGLVQISVLMRVVVKPSPVAVQRGGEIVKYRHMVDRDLRHPILGELIRPSKQQGGSVPGARTGRSFCLHWCSSPWDADTPTP